MSKFKINEKVISVENGNVGVVRARDIVHENKKTTVKYMVDFGGGMESWKVLTKKDIKKVSNPSHERPYVIREYEHDNNQKLIMTASVKPQNFIVSNPNAKEWFDTIYERKGKVLSIGFAIYNGLDEYDFNVGRKYAVHRMKHNPFCQMESKFGGEFNDITVEAIMDVKAKYIKDHWDEFYRPRN